MRTIATVTRFCGILLGLSLLGGTQAVQAQEGKALVNARCAACHAAQADGTLDRINAVRKTPEAWDMTLVRMMIVHGVKMTAVDRRKLVKYLSDTRGLAPSEGKAYRYILEKRPGVTDTGPNTQLTQFCGRCHSYARVALQRRTKADWLKLTHFHLGQFPTAEYQALGRDRDWWGIVSTKVVDAVAKLYPLNTKAWTAWKARKASNLQGYWRVVGHEPGKGDYAGVLSIGASGNDTYSVTTRLVYSSNGAKLVRRGTAILYSGHEWRASTRGRDGRARHVMSLSEDGNMMTGRWFRRGNDVVGGTFKAVRMTGAPTMVLSVSPGYIKRGRSTRVTISGIRFPLDFKLGPGLRGRVLGKTATSMVLMVRAAANAPLGPRAISVGKASLAAGLVVYDKVAAVKITPSKTIARVGGNRGPIPPMPAQFEAVAYMAGPDGKPGTKDDIRIGVMPAAWKVDNFDAAAKALKDASFAGRITKQGLFNPAGAGPNPARKMSTNNVGNLAVTGTVRDGGRLISGKAQLFVTVQRFVDPPIR